jgi:transglutaminase-like putative cysteine protease
MMAVRFGFLILCAVALLSVVAGPVRAQALLRLDDPAWIDVAEVPPLSPALRAEAEDGIHYLLGDRQIRWDGEVREDFYRNVYAVVDRAGLEEAATLSYEFDPEFEEVILTRLRILRDGTVIDLRDTLTEEVYRRETRLEEGIIDGALTAVLQIPGLKVGDVVDSAVLRRVTPIIPGAPRSGSGYLEFGEPVGMERFRLIWDQDRPLNVGTFPGGDRVRYASVPDADGTVVHEWTVVGGKGIAVEEDLPAFVDARAVIRFSDAADWRGLAQALAPHYTKDYPLPSDWQARLDTIAAENAEPLDRATAALRMVQDDIRYVSLSVGAGGYFARTPEEVIRTGFGDCKDKALLLRVMLDRLGIEAAVALTDIDQGYGLNALLPSERAFDHMIVRIKSDDLSYWVDATATHQGGRIDMAPPPDYGFALPVTSSQTALEPIPIDPYGQWRVEVMESYSFTFLGMWLSVDTVYLGEAANDRRRHYGVTPVSTQSDEYLDFYAERYPGLRLVRPLTVEDDREANLVTVRESYFLPAMALMQDDLRTDFYFGTENFASNLPEASGAPRKYPMYTGSASSHTHTVHVTNAPIGFTPAEAVTIENDAFAFSYSGYEDGDNGMTLSWDYTRKGPVVRADKVAGILEDAAKVADLVWWTWDLTPTE